MDKPKLVIFDCDGTLVDSQAGIVAAMHFAFDHVGLDRPTAADVRQQVGLPLGQVMANLAHSVDKALINRLAEGYQKAVYEEQLPECHRTNLFPHCREVLESLHEEGYMLGIATGMGRRGLKHTVEELEMEHLFTVLKSADDGPGKPNPDILLDAMLECGVERSDAVMIGDTTFDIQAGVNAKIPAIGVDWGYHAPEQLMQVGASQLVSDFRELPAVIERLMKD